MKKLTLTSLLCMSLVSVATAVPPPRSVQVFFDSEMQTNSFFGQVFVVAPFRVLAYDLPDDVSAYRFRFVTNDPSVVFFGTFPDSLQNVGTGDDYVLEVDGCLDGDGIVELARGLVLVVDQTVEDVTLCLGPVSAPEPGTSGLDYRPCDSSDWVPMELLYEGCAVLNPNQIVPAPITNNDPNALAMRSLPTYITGEPTDAVSMGVQVRRALRKSGDPAALARLVFDVQWDPGVATYQSLVVNLPSGWSSTPQLGPGSLTLTLQGSTPWRPSTYFNGTLFAVWYQLSELEGQTPISVTMVEAVDQTDEPVLIEPLADLTLEVTCPKGDVVRNSDVNALDALMTLEFAVGGAVPDPKDLCRADMNATGDIDAGDAALILAKAVGLAKAPFRVWTNGALPVAWYEIDLAEAVGVDLVASWEGEMSPLMGWEVEGEFYAAEREEVGAFRLALARVPSTERGVLRLASNGIGPVHLSMFRLWNDAGELLDERGGEVLFASGKDLPSVRLLSVVPNPFNPETEISFVVSQPGKVRLSVFDARGRRVWTNQLVVATAGEHTVRWRGVDERGAPLASGRYNLLVESGSGSDQIGLTLLK